ncbi:MAG: OsmC family peroxiredoxin [Streptosporangiales bacterium]|nr:OsmC family peroxiredoxin [Streptosporangiales bacterium]
MPRTHRYELDVNWTGNTGQGTAGYRAFERDHEVTRAGVPGRPPIPGTADPAFRGVEDRWNPEELLVASLSQCHMLWFLALCSQARIVVTAYTDHPYGTMTESATGSGAFDEVVLRPRVTLASERLAEAEALHKKAHEMCFIANSVNFPVRHEPEVIAES